MRRRGLGYLNLFHEKTPSPPKRKRFFTLFPWKPAARTCLEVLSSNALASLSALVSSMGCVRVGVSVCVFVVLSASGRRQ